MIHDAPLPAGSRDINAARRSLVEARTPLRAPSVLLVGASTGGPQALVALVAGLVPTVNDIPVCVSLHMPPDLVPVVAAHLARTCGVRTEVVRTEGDLLPGTIYFGPSDRHIEFCRGTRGSTWIGLSTNVVGYYCKPAVDVMFSSAAACFGSRTLAVVLSGMGKDGLAGSKAIVAAGGTVLVQDKKSSAVWGMPGSVDKADLATAALAPADLAREIARRVTRIGRRP